MFCKFSMRDKRGQIWVETVVYTLIGLALIGIVLAIAIPKVNETKDRIVVDQTISALNDFNEKFREVLDRPPGNKRVIDEFLMKRGELQIDGVNDMIVFLLDGLEDPYSESGIPIENGAVIIIGEEGQKDFSVRLTLDYSGVSDLKYNGGDELKQFAPTSIPYSFSIENLGSNVDIREISRS